MTFIQRNLPVFENNWFKKTIILKNREISPEIGRQGDCLKTRSLPAKVGGLTALPCFKDVDIKWYHLLIASLEFKDLVNDLVQLFIKDCMGTRIICLKAKTDSS